MCVCNAERDLPDLNSSQFNTCSNDYRAWTDEMPALPITDPKK